MPTVVCEQAVTECPGGRAEGDDLWLSSSELAAATGWALKPEGLCKGDVCVPVPPAKADSLVRAQAVNVAEFWRHLGHPVVHDDQRRTWVLGASGTTRAAKLASLEAPDFSLPDLAGVPHALANYRGRRVLIATWASW